MWIFIVDSSAASLCRAYNGIVGHFPTVCLVDAGHPMLGISATVLFAAFALVLVWRAHRARRVRPAPGSS